MRIESEVKLDFSDVLIKPKRSALGSRKAVELYREYTFKNYISIEPAYSVDDKRSHYNGIPIMAANMDGVGTFEMADRLGYLGMFSCLAKTYSAEKLIRYFRKKPTPTEYVAYSMGIMDHDYDKFKAVYADVGDDIKYVCVDVANGYSSRFNKFIQTLRKDYPFIVIIAGNVVTGNMTEELILSGADIVKVGIGPGSVCTTRIKTGVGYPQLSAIIECADAAHGLGGHIIADGGCGSAGDVAKAFGAGADFVMLGGMLAGCDEGGGEVIYKNFSTTELVYEVGTHLKNHTPVTHNKAVVRFYGMSSDSANKKHFGGLKDYRTSEGREVLIDYKGAVADVVQDILGGLRSACTYAGAKRLKDLCKCTTFIKVNNQYNRIFENK